MRPLSPCLVQHERHQPENRVKGLTHRCHFKSELNLFHKCKNTVHLPQTAGKESGMQHRKGRWKDPDASVELTVADGCLLHPLQPAACPPHPDSAHSPQLVLQAQELQNSRLLRSPTAGAWPQAGCCSAGLFELLCLLGVFVNCMCLCSGGAGMACGQSA